MRPLAHDHLEGVLLAVMAGAGKAGDAPGRDRLAELMALFPDEDGDDEFR